MLHNKFYVVPLDKASGNVAFICQRHYAQDLINELGLNNVNNISTYSKAIKPADKIVSNCPMSGANIQPCGVPQI